MKGDIKSLQFDINQSINNYPSRNKKFGCKFVLIGNVNVCFQMERKVEKKAFEIHVLSAD